MHIGSQTRNSLLLPIDISNEVTKVPNLRRVQSKGLHQSHPKTSYRGSFVCSYANEEWQMNGGWIKVKAHEKMKTLYVSLCYGSFVAPLTSVCRLNSRFSGWWNLPSWNLMMSNWKSPFFVCRHTWSIRNMSLFVEHPNMGKCQPHKERFLKVWKQLLSKIWGRTSEQKWDLVMDDFLLLTSADGVLPGGIDSINYQLPKSFQPPGQAGVNCVYQRHVMEFSVGSVVLWKEKTSKSGW